MAVCIICRQLTQPTEISTGYGTDKHGRKICFECCGRLDARTLEKTGKLTGYLSYKQVPRNYRTTGFFTVENGFFTNWPGTLKIPVYAVKKSFNNFGAPRYDFWFSWHGRNYHGVHVGDQSQIARVMRVKG